jgi:hypothetical protein
LHSAPVQDAGFKLGSTSGSSNAAVEKENSMKASLRTIATSVMLALPAAAAVSFLPASALAQPAPAQVSSLDADADAGIEPGSRLRFRLIGSRRQQATVRIEGVREPIALRETAPGVYVGRYTLKRTDRVSPASPVRAILRQGNRTSGSEYALGQLLDLPAPVAVVPQPAARPVDPVRIERFGMVPVERIEPGAELQFAVEGMSGANVSVDLPGVERDLRLRETRPGHYEGSYTIRRNDDFAPNRPAVATLRAGERVVTAQMNIVGSRAGADTTRPGGPNVAVVPARVPLRVLNFRNNDQVGAGQTVVHGATQPNATVNVRVIAMAPVGGPVNISQELLARTVQADQNGNFSFSFQPQLPIPGARYEIEMASTRGNQRDDEKLTLIQR